MCLLKDIFQKNVNEGRICRPTEVKFLVQIVVRLGMLFLVSTCTHTTDTRKGMATAQIFYTDHSREPKWHQQYQGFVPPKVILPENARSLREWPTVWSYWLDKVRWTHRVIWSAESLVPCHWKSDWLFRKMRRNTEDLFVLPEESLLKPSAAFFCLQVS